MEVQKSLFVCAITQNKQALDSIWMLIQLNFEINVLDTRLKIGYIEYINI